MEISTSRFESNEITKSDDFNNINSREYNNLVTLFEELCSHATKDIIISGLNVQQRGTPSMNVDITYGLAYCQSTGKLAHSGAIFGPVAITNGDGSNDRLDTLEIRLVETNFDQQQRAYKDPATGEITFQDVFTKTRYEMEVQVIDGTPGSGVAPDHTAGWIKIAEIFVETGEVTSVLDADIENCTGGYDTEITTNWTAETADTFRIGSLSDFKTLFRVKHKEDGDHVNDVIKDNHIDFGVGANQISAIDIPIADAGSLITATEIETALQELALVRVPVGTIIAQIDGYFADGSNGTFTLASVSLTDNWKVCDGSVLNDADSPIFNGAGRYLPNLADDRFLMGDIAGNLGDIGGSNTTPNHTHTDNFSEDSHVLLISEMPVHTHVQNQHRHSFTLYEDGIVGGGNAQKTTTPYGQNTGYTTATNQNTGGGGGHVHGLSGAILSSGAVAGNEPKYLVCKYIMRIK